MTIPDYDDLPTVGPHAERASWGVFGAADELGCLNFIDADAVAAAASEVSTGEVVNLNLAIGEPQPQFWNSRPRPVHHREHRGNIRDDSIDAFPMQGSTQWDGLRHQRYREFGFYGGRQDEDLDSGDVLGVHVWAERGIVGRGVLVDVEGFLASRGTPVDPQERLAIDAKMIEESLASQRTELSAGDLLLVRTGWLGWFLGLEPDYRAALVEDLERDRSKAALPGIDARAETAAWLWNHRVAALATDNPTLETIPYRREDGWAHHRLLSLLGMPLGELWSLDRLAERCRALGKHTFLLSASPLNLRGGAGSPANAYAVL